ncbi:hypothetical protein D3C87_1485820 [compost metagenome]
MYFTHHRLGRRLEAAAAVVMLLLPAAAATRATAPATHAARRIAARLQAAALLARAFVLPRTGLDRLAGLLVDGGRGRGGGRGRFLLVLLGFGRRAGRLHRLVQRAGLLGLLFLGLAFRRRLQHAGRGVQHLLDRTGLGLGSLAAAAGGVLLGTGLVGRGLRVVRILLHLHALGSHAGLVVLGLLAHGGVLDGVVHRLGSRSLFLGLAG